MKNILLLSKIKIHDANALSSPYTIGFPAMTAWLGAAHALQRKLNQKEEYKDLKFNSVSVVLHDFNLQTYKGEKAYVHSIIATRNPIKKDGTTAAFIESARCHLTISLVVEYDGFESFGDDEDLEKDASELLHKMKFAGGDILSFKEIKSLSYGDKDKKGDIEILKRIMPGYAIVERSSLIDDEIGQGKNAIDAVLNHLKINNICEEVEDNKGEKKVEWKKPTRQNKGWIVPIAIGFHGLTELEYAENQRDDTTPHRFAESVVSLGEFIMPHHLINDIDQMLWHYEYDAENSLYLCKQNKLLTN